MGNRQIEGLVLMNLGVAHESMGHADEAGRYYQQSRDVYQEIGDERRAAEQEYNAAALQVKTNPADAFRRLANARATFHTLGYVDFEVATMRAQAESLAATGRPNEALRLLREAASIARERQLNQLLAEVKMWIGKVQLGQGENDAARKTLEEVVATPEAPAEAEIVLVQAYLRSGDLPDAKKHLEQALAVVRKSGETKLVAEAERSLADLPKGDVDQRTDK